MVSRRLFIGTTIALILMIGVNLTMIWGSINAQSDPNIPPTPRNPVYLPKYEPNIPPVTDLVFENVPGPDVPTLQEIGAGATTDEELLQRIADYYDVNRERLRGLWRIEDDTRLAATFAMYIVHVSTPYGETRYQTSLVDYLTLTRSHCGTYSLAQRDIVKKLGLTWREVSLSSGWHGWIEILIDGNWEVFDATTNVWISKSGFDLVNGVEREYRYFYTPLLDINRPDARLHLQEGYNMDNLRSWMPGLGLFYIPPGHLFIASSYDGHTTT